MVGCMAQKKELFDIGSDNDLQVAMMNLHMAMQCAEENAGVVPLLQEVRAVLGQYAKCSDADIAKQCDKYFYKKS